MSQKVKTEGDNPVLTIRLDELFGVKEFPDDDGLKAAIADDIIERIRDRTQSGKDKDDKSFRGYSKTYIESLDFIAFGKSRNNVNLTLSGDMLDSMDARLGDNTIMIDFVDSENASKATGHIKGSGFLPIRDFFGLSSDDISDIKDRYDIEVKASIRDEETPSSVLGEALVSIATLLDDDERGPGGVFGF